MMGVKDQRHIKETYSKKSEEGADSPGGGCAVAGQGLSTDLGFTSHSRLLLYFHCCRGGCG